MNDTPETMKLAEQGRLSQRCPSCGITEAAGWYCTACLTKTGPADWFAQSGRTAAANEARKATARRSDDAGREEAAGVAS